MNNIIKVRFNQDAQWPEFATIGERFGTSAGYTLCSPITGRAGEYMKQDDWCFFTAKVALEATFPEIRAFYGYTDGFLPDATFVFQF